MILADLVAVLLVEQVGEACGQVVDRAADWHQEEALQVVREQPNCYRYNVIFFQILHIAF